MNDLKVWKQVVKNHAVGLSFFLYFSIMLPLNVILYRNKTLIFVFEEMKEEADKTKIFLLHTVYVVFIPLFVLLLLSLIGFAIWAFIEYVKDEYVQAATELKVKDYEQRGEDDT